MKNMSNMLYLEYSHGKICSEVKIDLLHFRNEKSKERCQNKLHKHRVLSLQKCINATIAALGAIIVLVIWYTFYGTYFHCFCSWLRQTSFDMVQNTGLSD
ncbi:hypothetical protein KIL84_020083 [Mauremys mutica]|uniref:Uncharacterized protein n=1 Tax=Mauremys mutica TaxID=74926 RepID=A0A9D4BBW5_9SAUR|nr:hypothetical protein KIL84_020083 [Mauremys mutica]